VRDEMGAEAAARQQALDSMRKHVGDELKATQRSVLGKLEKTDKDLAAHEQAVAKLERALAMVKEAVQGEKESREALKMTLTHGIEVVRDSTHESSRRCRCTPRTKRSCCVSSTHLGDASATAEPNSWRSATTPWQ
jgi:hypothetical protein